MSNLMPFEQYKRVVPTATRATWAKTMLERLAIAYQFLSPTERGQVTLAMRELAFESNEDACQCGYTDHDANWQPVFPCPDCGKPLCSQCSDDHIATCERLP